MVHYTRAGRDSWMSKCVMNVKTLFVEIARVLAESSHFIIRVGFQAVVRFEDGDGAKNAWEKAVSSAADGKVTVLGQEVQGRIIEGRYYCYSGCFDGNVGWINYSSITFPTASRIYCWLLGCLV